MSKTKTGALPHSAGFPGRNMTAEKDMRPDSQKLYDIADWFDRFDPDGDDTMQRDLRRIAKRLENVFTIDEIGIRIPVIEE